MKLKEAIEIFAKNYPKLDISFKNDPGMVSLKDIICNEDHIAGIFDMKGYPPLKTLIPYDVIESVTTSDGTSSSKGS